MEMGGNKGSDYESGISWGGKTKKGSAAQIVMAILLVICVIIIIVLAVLLAKKNQDKEDATPSPKIEELQCISKECVEISGSILKSMNLSADPCEDFYEYACGSFDEDPLIPPSYAKYGWFEIITKRVSANSRRVLDEAGNVYKGKESSAIEKVKMIYNVCLNTTATEALGSKALLEWIKELGSWTVTSDEFSGTWQESTFDLERSVAKIYEYAVTPLIKMSLAADLMNNTINRLSFDQPGLSYPSASIYIGSNSEFFKQVQSQYFVDIVTLLGSNQTQAEKIAEEMWNFETELAKIMDKPEDRLDTYKLHNIMTLHDFQDLIDDTKDVFDLGKFLAEVFKEEVPNTKEINVVAPTFFSKLGLVIENTETRTLANYLVWKAIQPVIGVLPKKFQDVASRKESILQGTVGEDPMWQKCVTMAEFAMPEALGALYVDKHFSKEAKLQVKKLVQTMLHQFRQNLPETPWMDSQTKEKAEEKVNAMTYEVGYPDFIEDPTKLDEYYVKLGVMNTNNFDNLRSVLKFRSYTSFLETWGKAPDRSRWPAGPTTTNAFYNGQINGMVYSAATLSEPFFSADYPMAMNYGSIGFIIAHEVTHGFDSGGRKLDKYGNLYNWWSNFSNINFVNKAQCMVDQYNEYTEQGHKLNGAITLQENIADNGGLSISYKAYQEWLKENGNSEQGARLPGLGNTENQLFFLAMAQSWCSYYTPQYAIIALSSTHAIDKYRVIGPLSNSPEFAEAYSCPKGSPMNPKSKCKVW